MTNPLTTEQKGKAFLIFLSFAGLGFFCGPVMDFAVRTHTHATPPHRNSIDLRG